MKYKINTTIGWVDVEGEPFEPPGYEHLGLFIHHQFGLYTVTEPRTGWQIGGCHLSAEEAKQHFISNLEKYTPEKIAECRDKVLEGKLPATIQVSLPLPQEVYTALVRRSKNDVPEYLSKRIIYDTMRKHEKTKVLTQ